jgi:hypothetical protein
MKIICLCLVLLSATSLLFAETEAPEKKDILLPCVLNVIPGLGVGSFVQGDVLGGVILLAGDVGSWACLFFGMFAAIGDDPTFVIVGGLLFCAMKILGIIRPIWFGLEYNAKLEEQNASLSVKPVVVSLPGDERTAIGVNVQLAFPL